MTITGNKRLNSKEIKHILIRSTNWIGDAVMTTPALRGVRKNFPEARIAVLAKPWTIPVFENNPHIDEIIPYDASGAAGKIELAGQLKQRGFDAAILFQNAFEAALIAYLARIPVRIGYDRDMRAPLLTHVVACTNGIRKLHQTHYYNEILKGVGLVPDGSRLELYVSSAERKAAGEILKREKIEDSDLVVGINPSSTFGPAKQWLPERFAEVSDRLNREFGTRTLVFGGPRDKELGRRIRGAMNTKAGDFSGRTTLNEAIALISRCDLFVTNDSGLMHVAAALNAPQIAVFGSTDQKATGPRSDRARIVRSDLSCAPCLERKCPLGHRKCMDIIGVDKVLSIARQILQKKHLRNNFPIR